MIPHFLLTTITALLVTSRLEYLDRRGVREGMEFALLMVALWVLCLQLIGVAAFAALR